MGNRLWPIIFLPIALDIYCTMSRTVSQGSRLISHKGMVWKHAEYISSLPHTWFTCTRTTSHIHQRIRWGLVIIINIDINCLTIKQSSGHEAKAGSAATTASISMFTWNWNNSYKNNLFYNLENLYLPGVRKKGDIKRGYWIN